MDFQWFLYHWAIVIEWMVLRHTIDISGFGENGTSLKDGSLKSVSLSNPETYSVQGNTCRGGLPNLTIDIYLKSMSSLVLSSFKILKTDALSKSLSQVLFSVRSQGRGIVHSPSRFNLFSPQLSPPNWLQLFSTDSPAWQKMTMTWFVQIFVWPAKNLGRQKLRRVTILFGVSVVNFGEKGKI